MKEMHSRKTDRESFLSSRSETFAIHNAVHVAVLEYLNRK